MSINIHLHRDILGTLKFFKRIVNSKKGVANRNLFHQILNSKFFTLLRGGKNVCKPIIIVP